MSSVADGTRGAAARAASTTGAATVPAPPATPRTRGAPQGPAAGHGEQEPTLTQNVRFSRAPAHTVNDLFDYSTRYGLSLYHTAVEPFPVKFDGDSKDVLSFANQFSRPAKKCNWDATLTFKQNGKDLHLARNFGAVDKKVLLDHVKSYSGQAVRHNQVSAQIFECLEQSLEPDIHSAITNRREEYVINDEEDGLLFFMAILQHSQTHTCGTVGILQNSLYLLPQHMVECDNNIRQFNDQVTEIKNALEAHGHPPEETNFINQLFAGYMACANTKFTEYISNKQDTYNDGGNVTASSLMSDALHKFKWRVVCRFHPEMARPQLFSTWKPSGVRTCIQRLIRHSTRPLLLLLRCGSHCKPCQLISSAMAFKDIFLPRRRQVLGFSAGTHVFAPEGLRDSPLQSRFDSDSFKIAINKCASVGMTNDLSHFKTPPKPTETPVTGLGAQAAQAQGTVLSVHSFEIAGALYLPNLPFLPLLSPQHRAQTATTNGQCITTKIHVCLSWGTRLKYTKTVCLHRGTNTAFFYTAPGRRCFQAYLATLATPVATMIRHCFPSLFGPLPTNVASTPLGHLTRVPATTRKNLS